MDRVKQLELFEENKPLVWWIMKEIVHHKSCFVKGDSDEVAQAGLIGLWKAILGYDESKGVQFSTFAVPCIKGAIFRYFQNRDTSRNQAKKNFHNNMRRLDEVTKGSKTESNKRNIHECIAKCEINMIDNIMIEEFIDSIPSQELKVIAKYTILGYTQTEIAKKLGTNQTMISRKIKLIRGYLKEYLKEVC